VILSDNGKIYAQRLNPYVPFLRVMADVQTFEYLNLVGDENDIGSECFKWPGSRVSTSSFKRNAIGLAVSYASAHPFVDAWYQSPGARGGGALIGKLHVKSYDA